MANSVLATLYLQSDTCHFTVCLSKTRANRRSPISKVSAQRVRPARNRSPRLGITLSSLRSLQCSTLRRLKSPGSQEGVRDAHRCMPGIVLVESLPVTIARHCTISETKYGRVSLLVSLLLLAADWSGACDNFRLPIDSKQYLRS